MADKDLDRGADVSARRWDGLHPATRASIEMQGRESGHDNLLHRCGCDLRITRVWLCQYHEGFEAGTEAATREEPT